MNLVTQEELFYEFQIFEHIAKTFNITSNCEMLYHPNIPEPHTQKNPRNTEPATQKIFNG